MLTVTCAQTTIDVNGVLRSKQFDDRYFSSSGAADECRHVFLQGNNFESRILNCEQFTVGEIGFGAGINFLTTADAWKSRRIAHAKLHYVSIEKYPIALYDLKEFYEQMSDSFTLAKQLLGQYPLPVSGTHRIEFPADNIALTLIYADALDALQLSSFTVDAWFLDGFAPHKNSELWSMDIAAQVYRTTRINGTFATYTAAGSVKNHFSAAGFRIKKQGGYGNKRDMLTGIRTQAESHHFSLKDKSWLLNPTCKPSSKAALVIGGGLAGIAIGAALAVRNWQVTLIERNTEPATEASGNCNAILMPRLSVDHDVQSQLTLQGFLYSLRYLRDLQALSKKCIWQECGVIQLPRDKIQWQRMQQITMREQLPHELLRSVSKYEAAALSGCEVAHAGWYYPQAGWVVPKNACSMLLEQNSNINFLSKQEISHIEYVNDTWHAFNNRNEMIATADTVILANALAVNQFEQTHWCKLHAKRGQITLIPEELNLITPNNIVCADAYITPPLDGQLVLGASFITNDTDTEIRDSEHADNIKKICRIIPDFSAPPIDTLNGRAAIRAVSPDRLPVVGPVAKADAFNQDFTPAALGASNTRYSLPDYFPGLYIATGFGSRGMAWIPICAEALACIINNEPLPFNQAIANAIHPSRFLMKKLIKKTQCTQ